ncbi:MAG: proprotein convertase P-domain-containing protein [Phycisphaeraceae bacterium]|nr:proprotein convertase P-domain-containing protein [Phycisphaeraceae bacterium]
MKYGARALAAVLLSGLAVSGANAQVQISNAAPIHPDKRVQEARDKEQGSVNEARAHAEWWYGQTRGPVSSERVIYGADNRIEVWQETDPVLRQMAEAACVVVFPSELVNNGNGTYTLNTSPWTSSGGTLCADEPFRGQPQIGFCSGFLVGTDIVATAGHCVGSGGVTGATNVAFVFNFEIDTSGGSAPTIVPASDVYFGVAQINQALGGGLDHSIVRVDRTVTGRNPVPIRRSGTISNGDPLVMIGHPVVIPKKIAGGAECKNDNGSTPWFQSNLDAYGGNSGSMVVNANTYEVEGILVRGAPDFVTSGGCRASNRVPDSGNTGGGLQFEECSKTTAFASHIPPLGMQVTPLGNTTHIGLVGGPFSPATVSYTLSNPTGDPVNYSVSLVSPTGNVLINGGTGTLSGSLPASGSIIVTASLAAGANALGAGIYTDTIAFSDLSNSRTVEAVHTLEIGQTLVTVSPASNLNASGPVGGPFSASGLYVITSERPTPVSVQVSADQPWVSLNGGSGPVTVGLTGLGDEGSVLVGVGPAAGSLPAGIQTATVTFQNLTSGATSTRSVVLDVGRYVYHSNDVPRPITDNSSFDSTLSVSDAYCIGDVDVSVDITHTYKGDLIVELISPEGTVVRLHNRTGGSDDNIIQTYNQGVINPDGPGSLDDFNGEIVTGTWTLRVSDNANIDTGTLNAWSLRIATSGPVCPPSASNGSIMTMPGTLETVTLQAMSGVGNPLDYIITSLPTVGALWDPTTNTGILSVPHTLAGGGNQVYYKSSYASSGSTSFTFKANDGLDSNTATVNVALTNEGMVAHFPLDTNPGWTTMGQWAWGVPTGGGSNGGDPTSGYTGPNVYGYNLAGDYPNNLSPTQYLTTTPINASNATNVRLKFWRRLGIESSTWDQANLQYSTNGSTWTTIWQHASGSFNELAWTEQEYALPLANNASTLYIRWGMGTTDSSVTYPGWNIDDISIIGDMPIPKLADFNGDTLVDILDFLDFLDAFGSEHPSGDYNADGQIDILDFLDFFDAFGFECCD